MRFAYNSLSHVVVNRNGGTVKPNSMNQGEEVNYLSSGKLTEPSQKAINNRWLTIKNMGSIRSILTSKWFWIIVILCSLVVVTPFVCLLIILLLPIPLNALATIGIVIAWGIVAGYKDWILSKKGEEERKSKS